MSSSSHLNTSASRLNQHPAHFPVKAVTAIVNINVWFWGCHISGEALGYYVKFLRSERQRDNEEMWDFIGLMVEQTTIISGHRVCDVATKRKITSLFNSLHTNMKPAEDSQTPHWAVSLWDVLKMTKHETSRWKTFNLCESFYTNKVWLTHHAVDSGLWQRSVSVLLKQTEVKSFWFVREQRLIHQNNIFTRFYHITWSNVLFMTPVETDMDLFQDSSLISSIFCMIPRLSRARTQQGV